MNLLQRIARSESPKLEKPLLAFFGYMLQGTGLSDRIHLQRPRYTIPFFSQSNVALTLWVKPDVVDRAEQFAYDFLDEGHTLIDVGANIGCVTAAASMKVAETGRVIAIEAHPGTFRLLKQTIELNQCENVTSLNVAAGAEPGVVAFTNERRKDDNNRVAQDGGELQVECRPLASIVQELQLDRIHLLKIDVEGFEMEVLRGAEPILALVDCLYVELLEHTLRKYGSSEAEVLTCLRDHGFSVCRFRDDPGNVVAFSSRVSSARWQHLLTPVGELH